jgi:hypothetical protein
MGAARRCSAPGCPVLVPRPGYCARHESERDRSRGGRVARGYGVEHQRLRATIQARIDRGESVACVTCGRPLAGRCWDLGHTADRSGYIGPQCRRCNRSDGGRRAHGGGGRPRLA